MTVWLDAQLTPALARWISEQPWGVDAVAVRELGLRDACDPEIFRQARAAGAVVIWLLLRSGEPWVEIRPQTKAET
jgi:predicted nuclease of predicted toxin-antitoxin system